MKLGARLDTMPPPPAPSRPVGPHYPNTLHLKRRRADSYFFLLECFFLGPYFLRACFSHDTRFALLCFL
jgi:hypothetical protein